MCAINILAVAAGAIRDTSISFTSYIGIFLLEIRLDTLLAL